MSYLQTLLYHLISTAWTKNTPKTLRHDSFISTWQGGGENPMIRAPSEMSANYFSAHLTGANYRIAAVRRDSTVSHLRGCYSDENVILLLVYALRDFPQCCALVLPFGRAFFFLYKWVTLEVPEVVVMVTVNKLVSGSMQNSLISVN